MDGFSRHTHHSSDNVGCYSCVVYDLDRMSEMSMTSAMCVCIAKLSPGMYSAQEHVSDLQWM